jgi:hypothetical protein
MLQNVSCFKYHFLWEIKAGKQRNLVRFPAGARGTSFRSSGLKLPWLEADHSLKSCAEIKNDRTCAYTRAVCCHGVHRVDLNFTQGTTERLEIKIERELFFF